MLQVGGGAFPNKTEALLFETYVPLREDRKYIKVIGCRG